MSVRVSSASFVCSVLAVALAYGLDDDQGANSTNISSQCENPAESIRGHNLMQTRVQRIRSDTLQFSDELFVHVEGLRTAPKLVDVEVRMSPAERDLFYKMVNKSTNYLEYGSGGSTAVVASSPGIKKAYSVESDKKWIAKLKKEGVVSQAVSDGRLNLIWVDTGPVGPWSVPLDPNSKSKWPSYSEQPLDHNLKFDTIFVDGRFRVQCFLKALRRIAPEDRASTVLMIHDYTSRRDAYKPVEEFADIVEQAEDLSVFRKKADVDSTKLEEAITQNEYNLRRWKKASPG